MANLIANASDFLSCLSNAATQNPKVLSPIDLAKLKALAQAHKGYLGTFSLPEKMRFSNALIPTKALGKLISGVELVRIYIGLDINAQDYTFIITQCDAKGNDIISKVGGADPLYHEFCCKCPPDTCPGAQLLLP